MSRFVPGSHQPPLPLDRLILSDAPDPDALQMDVLFVGAGPAGLAGAIELARLVQQDGSVGEVNIGVLEKAGALGEHCLSGAVVNPRVFRELFPDLPVEALPFRGRIEREEVRFLTRQGGFRIPTPPTMRNHGYYSGSLCEMVRWLGTKAEELGVNIFPGFPADALLVEGSRVRGVRTASAGLARDGTPGADYQPPTDLTARVTVLTEGTRGTLSQAWRQWQQVGSPNPQIFALGVKEVWEVPRPLDHVVHTMGWPLPGDTFGGTFMYPMGPAQVALGLVAGLDAPRAGFDVHELLQRTKLHPFVRPFLEGGRLLEWGAKTIPEGGYWSIPERLSGDGVLMAGDCAGFVDVASLKGIHYAMQSGTFAARSAFESLKAGDCSAATLASYDRRVRESYLLGDLKKTRNMRLAFKHGFLRGGVENGLMTLTGGAFPGRRIAVPEDAAEPRETGPTEPFTPDNLLTFSKLDAVFKSGNATRDTIPSHLLVGADVTAEVADFYSHLCPAGVYERTAEGLRVNPPNCIDCKATDVLGPRWTPREGGERAEVQADVTLGQRIRELRARLRDIWAPPDGYLLDAGTSAELMVAKVRLALTTVLLTVPLTNMVVAGPGEWSSHVAGLLMTTMAVLIALAAYRVVQRGQREQWLPLATSLMDVTLVSLALLVFSLIGDPHQAVNSKVTFETYFLAIGATCLRYDLRVSVIAGFVAFLEYGLVLLVVVLFHDLDSIRYAPWVYGRFYWSEQASRLILLTLFTILCTMIVYRLQRHRRLSNSDRLTGLFNRAYFEDFLAAEVRRSRRYSRSFAVAMVDIDRFKNFNDTYGHAAGDMALKAVAGTIQRALRRSDLVARYGGEEMVLVMPETTLAAARKRLEGVREAVAGEAIRIPKRDEQVRITVSAGVACWPVDGEDPDDLLHIADARLFHAKALGRNRVVASSVAAASV